MPSLVTAFIILVSEGDSPEDREVMQVQQTAGTSASQFVSSADTAVQPSSRLTIIVARPHVARSHLSPFPFGPGHSGTFEDADDCTVPSTPTLFVPRRTDDFAEAISSPQTNRPTFSFAPPSENNNFSQSGGLESGVSEGGM